MDKEKLESYIHDAGIAGATLGWLEPLLIQSEKELIDSVKTCFKNGKHTELVLACHVAQLCAIDDLRNKIHSIINRAESAKQELEEPKDDWRSTPRYT